MHVCNQHQQTKHLIALDVQGSEIRMTCHPYVPACVINAKRPYMVNQAQSLHVATKGIASIAVAQRKIA